jgi:hypothetical protein
MQLDVIINLESYEYDDVWVGSTSRALFVKSLNLKAQCKQP